MARDMTVRSLSQQTSLLHDDEVHERFYTLWAKSSHVLPAESALEFTPASINTVACLDCSKPDFLYRVAHSRVPVIPS